MSGTSCADPPCGSPWPGRPAKPPPSHPVPMCWFGSLPQFLSHQPSLANCDQARPANSIAKVAGQRGDPFPGAVADPPLWVNDVMTGRGDGAQGGVVQEFGITAAEPCLVAPGGEFPPLSLDHPADDRFVVVEAEPVQNVRQPGAWPADQIFGTNAH